MPKHNMPESQHPHQRELEDLGLVAETIEDLAQDQADAAQGGFQAGVVGPVPAPVEGFIGHTKY
jgi:hypothetical protein